MEKAREKKGKKETTFSKKSPIKIYEKQKKL